MKIDEDTLQSTFLSWIAEVASCTKKYVTKVG
jgi:hypothetical protein